MSPEAMREWLQALETLLLELAREVPDPDGSIFLAVADYRDRMENL